MAFEVGFYLALPYQREGMHLSDLVSENKTSKYIKYPHLMLDL